jgi:hypothetical protein
MIVHMLSWDLDCVTVNALPPGPAPFDINAPAPPA